MKGAFRNLSIRLKLILLMMLISFGVLALAAGIFLAIEIRSEAQEVENELTSLASIIGFNCRAALVFGDREAAEKTLGALKLRPEVVGAWLLRPEGEIFARYLRRPADDGPLPDSRPGSPGSVGEEVVTYRLADGSLLLEHAILLDEEVVGFLRLQADLKVLKARAAAFGVATATVLFASFFLSLLLAAWLQRFISRPIVELTGLMERVAREEDFAARLESRGNDEVGQLIAGFNTMLGQIEGREEALAEANRTLEARVAARTDELSQVNAELARLLEEHRQAEQTLRRSEEKYRSLFDNAPVSFWEQDFSKVFEYFALLRRQGVADFAAYFDQHPEEVGNCAEMAQIIDVNQRTLSLFAADDKEAFFAGVGDIFTERSADSVRAVFVALAEGQTAFETEGVNRTLAGEERFLLIRYSLLPAIGGPPHRAIISLLDITERKLAEEAMRQGEEQLQFVLEGSELGFWDWDITGGEVRRNERWAEMLGYTLDDIRLTVPNWTDLIHPDDRLAAWHSIEDHLEGRSPVHRIRYRMQCNDGEYKWILDHARVVSRDPAGHPLRMCGTHTDINDMVRAEEALRQGESRFRSLFENSPVSLWEEDFSAVGEYLKAIRREGGENLAAYFALHPEAVAECARRIRILDVNQATVQLYKAAGKEELLGNIAKVFGEESFEPFREELVALGEGRMSFEAEGVNRSLDGEKLYVSMRLSVVPGYEKTLSRVIVSIVDLSERRRAEEALRQSEERFRQMVDLLPQTIFEADVEGRLTFANRAGLEAFGYLQEEILQGLSVLEAIAPEEREEALLNLRRVLQGERVGPVERTMCRRDGSTYPALVHVGPILHGLKPVGMRGLIIDISERKQAEEAMRVLGKAIQTTQVGVTITDLEGVIVFTNQAEARMHGYESSELLGRRANMLGVEELRETQPERTIKTWQRESRNLRKDGSTFPVRLVSDLVSDAAGYPLAIVTVCEDITERKEAEERLKTSLVEKDVLLKEVHHRVKNNLQIISSLLNLQLKKIVDEKTRGELNATRDRIRSMALIHAKLYQSENIAQIDFAEYVSEFADQLVRLYDVRPERIRLLLDVEKLYLDVDVAIPCGMIINALLTNALKYAFPGGGRGEIVVRLRAEEQLLRLCVEDDGVGIPPQVDIENSSSLGLQLVRALVQQLGGRMSVERDGGRRIEVQMPEKGRASERL